MNMAHPQCTFMVLVPIMTTMWSQPSTTLHPSLHTILLLSLPLHPHQCIRDPSIKFLPPHLHHPRVSKYHKETKSEGVTARTIWENLWSWPNYSVVETSDRLTLIGMREGTFHPLAFFKSDFVSWLFIKNFQPFWKLTSVGLIWRLAKVIAS